MEGCWAAARRPQPQQIHLFDTILEPIWHPGELQKCILGRLGGLMGASWASICHQRPKTQKRNIFDTIFDPSWTHFEIHFGTQKGSKQRPKTNTDFVTIPGTPRGTILSHFGTHFGSILDSADVESETHRYCKIIEKPMTF